MKIGLLLLVALCLAVVQALPADRTSLNGFKVLRLIPTNLNQVSTLNRLEKNAVDLDFWSSPRGVKDPVDVMVPPEEFENIVGILKAAEIEHEVIMDDVQRTIEKQKVEQSAERRTSTRAAQLSFTKYNRVNEIHRYLDELAAANPSFVTVTSIGKSTEGRDLKLIKIGKPSSSGKKPAIWIDAGIHAREWIAPATATYVIDQLVNHYSTNKNLVDTIDWYILPVVNPDGYEYTFTNYRLWRKTRSRNSNGCFGTDGNRNFDFHWNEGGTSNDPCSDIYRGTKPFSEPETKAIRDFVMPMKSDFKVFLTVHSYSQMWLTPWGYTSALPNDYNDLVSLAKKATNALTAVHGTSYRIGSSTNLLGVGSGGTDDWARGAAGIKYSYTVELRDTGRYAFLLPPSQIVDTGRETFQAIKVFGEAAKTM